MSSTQATNDAASFQRISQPDVEELASQVLSLASISLLSMIMGSKTGDSRFGELSAFRAYLAGYGIQNKSPQDMAIQVPFVPAVVTIVNDDGTCYIGLQPTASIPLMVYDFIFNLYLTTLFLKPILTVGRGLRANRKGSGLYRLAKRTLVSAVVCLFVSLANLLTLVVVGGSERGVTCLMFCTADVTINVLTIHWVTNGHDSKKQAPTGKQAANVSRSNDNDDLSPYRSAVKVDVQITPSKEDDYLDEDVHSIQASQTSGKPLNYDDDEKV
ncbi:unnamed protein product [Umbelopsis vinacea]